MRRRLDNTNNDLEIKVRKFKSYNANRRKRRPYQRRNIQHAAAAAYNGNDDVDVFDMEFNRPQITSFPITNTNNNNNNKRELINYDEHQHSNNNSSRATTSSSSGSGSSSGGGGTKSSGGGGGASRSDGGGGGSIYA